MWRPVTIRKNGATPKSQTSREFKEQIMKIYREFMPPILLKLLRKMTSKYSHQIFPDYSAALYLCTTSAYEEKELIEVI